MTIRRPRALTSALALALTLTALTAPLLGQSTPPASTELRYRVELGDQADDRFRVQLSVDGLTEESAVLQFAATAPGTYQVMDVGRFVEDLRVTDAAGGEIPVERVSTNQWRITAPGDARQVTYRIAETFDTPVEEHPVYPMAGTSIEADHMLFNAHAVLAFPTGMQDAPA
ncbi:MAG TPA: peptidase, partial [Gemmatimonadota bacterium]|nr:peptidase [Gemmatimonadota bacterium]